MVATKQTRDLPGAATTVAGTGTDTGDTGTGTNDAAFVACLRCHPPLRYQPPVVESSCCVAVEPCGSAVAEPPCCGARSAGATAEATTTMPTPREEFFSR